jgi:hypothetical protein
VNTPGIGVHELRQRIDVRALQLHQPAPLEDLPRDVMRQRQLLEHFHRSRRRPRGPGPFQHGQLELVEENLRELFRRVDVELAAGHLEDRRRTLRELLIHLQRLRRQRATLQPDARALDRHEHRNERQLEPFVELVELFFHEQRAYRGRDLPDEIRALAGIVERGFDRHIGERQGLHTAAAHVLFGQRLVAGVLEREILNQVPRPRRVEQVARQHRVHVEPAQRDAVSREDDRVELQIVPLLLDGLVFEDRPERRQRGVERQAGGIAERPVADRHVVAVSRAGGKRQPDNRAPHRARPVRKNP